MDKAKENAEIVVVDVESRIDQFLSKKLNISRNQITNFIRDKNILVDKKIVDKPSFTLKIGQIVEVNKLNDEDSEFNDFTINFEVEIVYEDDDVLVINKPPNLIVHSAPSVKEATLVDYLKFKDYTLSSINGEIRAGIVHRIDKDTSGIMVVAKNDEAHIRLSNQLKERSMTRLYLAIIDLPLKENLIINRPIGRNPKNRLKKAIIENGRISKSAFLNLYSDENINIISAKLFSGRTHQIRVHLSSINRHILGDNLYGFKSKKDKIKRTMLHAYILQFRHPKTGENMKFTANLWDDFSKILDKSKNKEKIYEKILPDNLISGFNDLDSWLWLT
ncbi:23S rRNA pseudouridine synthase [Campylobacter blaseri]|nr:RluA family pseudouridine synthase [Campylobacter blaseri]QKF86460.1 23S rRNA pseudouridine synthase [Campylobacter blaseri]